MAIRNSKYKGTVYEGDGAYAFISYAHRDEDIVFPVISGLNQGGLNLWFDDGIIAGSEWPEYLASHIENSALVIAFISESSIASEYCKREIHFALKKKIPLIAVYVDDAKLSAGLEMQLAPVQGVKRKKYASDDAMVSAMLENPVIASLINGADAPKKEVKPVEEAPVVEKNTQLSSLFDIELSDPYLLDIEPVENGDKIVDEQFDKANQLFNDGDVDGAVDAAEYGIGIWLSIHKHESRIDPAVLNYLGILCNHLGRCYENREDWSKTEYYYEKSVNISSYISKTNESLLYRFNLITSLNNVATIYRKDGQIGLAKERIMTSLKLVEPYLSQKEMITSKHGAKIIDAYEEYGECLLYEDNYAKALTAYRTGKELAVARVHARSSNPLIGDHPYYEMFNTSNNVARALELLGDKESVSEYKEALKYAKIYYRCMNWSKASAANVLLIYENLAHIYGKYGNAFMQNTYKKKAEKFKQSTGI